MHPGGNSTSFGSGPVSAISAWQSWPPLKMTMKRILFLVTSSLHWRKILCLTRFPHPRMNHLLSIPPGTHWLQVMWTKFLKQWWPDCCLNWEQTVKWLKMSLPISGMWVLKHHKAWPWKTCHEPSEVHSWEKCHQQAEPMPQFILSLAHPSILHKEENSKYQSLSQWLVMAVTMTWTILTSPLPPLIELGECISSLQGSTNKLKKKHFCLWKRRNAEDIDFQDSQPDWGFGKSHIDPSWLLIPLPERTSHCCATIHLRTWMTLEEINQHESSDDASQVKVTTVVLKECHVPMSKQDGFCIKSTPKAWHIPNVNHVLIHGIKGKESSRWKKTKTSHTTHFQRSLQLPKKQIADLDPCEMTNREDAFEKKDKAHIQWLDADQDHSKSLHQSTTPLKSPPPVQPDQLLQQETRFFDVEEASSFPQNTFGCPNLAPCPLSNI